MSPFIDGQWLNRDTAPQLECLNPASEEVVARVQTADVQDVQLAVDAAKTALQGWRRTSGASRAVYLNRIADTMSRDRDKLVQLSVLFNGKPAHEASLDIDDVISCYRYYAAKATELDHLQEQDVPLSLKGVATYVRYEAAGLVALIVPWNFPLVTSAWKIAPALAAGCTLILKPAESTSAVELELGRIAQEVELPPGVLNILPGIGAEIGEQLTQHRHINKISFTGSNKVGESVMKAAAPLSKSVSLELGGKSPILVFDDADIDQAVTAVMAGIFYNCGQMCSATSRLLVQQDIQDALLEKLVAAVEQLRIGPGDDEHTEMGPMTTAAQFNTVLDYFEIAKQEQLTLLVGGRRAKQFEKGYYIEPTIYKNVPLDSRLWREEIFGPVLSTHTFRTEDEAIAMANDSNFGLAATVVSRDEERLRRVSAQLEAGHIWWNMPQVVAIETSWGGFKQSGIGRELGPWGLSAFLEVKHVDYMPDN
jgi:betaine-aldehyde dehydrogenase